MTLGTQASTTTMAGNGVTTSFPYAFIIPDASEAVVTYTDTSGTQVVLTPLQYTISGIGTSTGGAVTYPLAGSPIATGTYLTIARNLPLIQAASISSQGPTFAAIEQELDYEMMCLQQAAAQVTTSLRVPATDTPLLTLPTLSLRINTVVGFDSSGQPTVFPIATAATVGVFQAGGGIFEIAANNTGTVRNGLVQMIDGTWAPPGTGAQFYNRYFNLEMTVGLSNRGTPTQLWNTTNAIISRSVVTSASMAGSHTIMDLSYCAIPVGVGVGDGNPGGGVPTNPYYQEIGGYAYNAIILTAGHYNEGIASYFYDNTGGAGVAAKSSNFLSVLVKNAASNLYLTYGFQAYSAGTQQSTYAPTSAYRVDGGWLTGLDLTGQSAGNYGIDMNGNASVYAIRLPYNKPIVSRDSGNTADVALIALAGTSIYLGSGAPTTTAIFSNSTVTFSPAADNTISCGLGGGTPLRWTAVWAVNGTIQTSDPSLKTNIQALPDALPIVRDLEPVTFSWKVGGQEYEEVLEEKLVQDTVPEEYLETEIVMIDGVAVQRKIPKTRETLVWNDHQVFDEAGEPVMVRLRRVGEDGKPVLDENGEPVFNVLPKTHQTPKMVLKTVPVQRLVERPGKRTHWGFLADNVQAALGKTGRDFGGYVEDEAGTKHLRPDQLIPVLCKAIQEMDARITELEGRRA